MVGEERWVGIKNPDHLRRAPPPGCVNGSIVRVREDGPREGWGLCRISTDARDLFGDGWIVHIRRSELDCGRKVLTTGGGGPILWGIGGIAMNTTERQRQLREACHSRLDALLDAEWHQATILGSWNPATPVIIEGSSRCGRLFLDAFAEFASFLRANRR